MESLLHRTGGDASKELLERALAPAGSPLRPVRMLVVLAHPDDEVLALGARLERLTAARIITVTDGVPTDGADARHHGFARLEDYRTARQTELEAALAHAGLPPEVAMPFPALPQVADQQASLHLLPLTLGLLTVFQDFAPEVVLTHPYEGGHPDHDACAFAVHTALQLYARDTPESPAALPPFLLLEAPFYHSDGHGNMRTGAFLEEDLHPPIIFALSEREQRNKQARLACFPSQTETLRQFGTEGERFRVAPPYDFTQRPHEGKLLYEHFHWGMDWSRFHRLASEALHQLSEQRPALQTAPPLQAIRHTGTLS